MMTTKGFGNVSNLVTNQTPFAYALPDEKPASYFSANHDVQYRLIYLQETKDNFFYNIMKIPSNFWRFASER